MTNIQVGLGINLIVTNWYRKAKREAKSRHSKCGLKKGHGRGSTNLFAYSKHQSGQQMIGLVCFLNQNDTLAMGEQADVSAHMT